jgi:hypothetical protein
MWLGGSVQRVWCNCGASGNLLRPNRAPYNVPCVTVLLPSLSSPLPGLKSGTLHTSTTITLEAPLPIAQQKLRLLQSKGNNYFKVSEHVTSLNEMLTISHFTLTPLLTSFSTATSDLGQQHQCNSHTSLSSPLPGLEPRTLCTHQLTPSKHQLPIVPQKPRPLQSKGNYLVSQRVTSPNEILLAHTPLTS